MALNNSAFHSFPVGDSSSKMPHGSVQVKVVQKFDSESNSGGTVTTQVRTVITHLGTVTTQVRIVIAHLGRRRYQQG